MIMDNNVIQTLCVCVCVCVNIYMLRLTCLHCVMLTTTSSDFKHKSLVYFPPISVSMTTSIRLLSGQFYASILALAPDSLHIQQVSSRPSKLGSSSVT